MNLKPIQTLCLVLMTAIFGCGKMGKNNTEQAVVKKVGKAAAAAGTASEVSAKIDLPAPGFVSQDLSASSSSYVSTAPAPIILGPAGLRKVYEPLFGATPRLGSVVDEFRLLPGLQSQRFFSQSESLELGEYFIYTRDIVANADVRISNMQWVESPGPDYFRALRSFAGDACRNLLSNELTNETNANNKLVMQNGTSVEKINEFLNVLLGYKSKIGFHKGAEAYKAAFDNMIIAAPLPVNQGQKDARKNTSYRQLCIALATDVRVFTR